MSLFVPSSFGAYSDATAALCDFFCSAILAASVADSFGTVAPADPIDGDRKSVV